MKIAFQFLALLITFGVVPLFYVIYDFQQIKTEHHNRIEQDNFNHLQYSVKGLQQFVGKLQSSIKILSSSDQLTLTALNPSQSNVALMYDFWRLSAESLQIYSQLRFVDTEGMEKLRLNYQDGVSYIVPKSELQFKGDRNYFDYAKQLKTGEIGHFGIDFEVENGDLVYPLIPTMRLLTPVDAINPDTGALKRYGYFIANVNVRQIYQSLTYETSNYLPLIISEVGDIILGHDVQPQFINMYPKNAELTFARAHQKLWAQMKESLNGSYYDGEQWYIYSRFNITPNHGGNLSSLTRPIFLLFVGQDPKMAEVYDEAIEKFIENSVYLFMIVFLISSGLTLWNSNHNKNSLESKIARAAMNGMSALVITDKQNKIIKVNQQFTQLSGYTLAEIEGKQPDVFASGKHNQEFYMMMWKSLREDGFWEGEITNKTKNGALIDQLLRLQTITDKQGDIQFYVASFVDITARKKLENRLRDLSERDPLTNSWNRRKFDQELNILTSKYNRYPDKEHTCLAIVDIDYFKRINDELGHDVGDSVIKSVSRTLELGCRETDFIARVGGEEFAILLPHTPLREAEVVLNRLRIAIELEHRYDVTISGGLTSLCARANESYKRADIALYDAKSSGRNVIKTLTVEEATEIA
ncbi:sensor domain-containing diguanylate cyclase [Vibrio maerlii]|uniref:sensor domain-containing diguanylate cyclase n=1 Tax=Vibrio maerlii TaxID=2231648 RepID=UPI0013E0E008|nr:sensor domain-containing diguanylate cyclase [Vibrio maerlii]